MDKTGITLIQILLKRVSYFSQNTKIQAFPNPNPNSGPLRIIFQEFY